MATINNQTEFDALRQAAANGKQLQVYDDAALGENNNANRNFMAGEITQPSGSLFTGQNLGSLTEATNYTADRCQLQFTRNLSSLWQAGTLNATNSIINYVGSGSVEWPGSQARANNARPTFDFTNTYIQGRSAGNSILLHLGCVGTGSDDLVIEGLTFGPFALMAIPFGVSDLNQLTFSNSTNVIGGITTYLRFNQFSDINGGSGDPALVSANWDALYQSDLSQWVNTTNTVTHLVVPIDVPQGGSSINGLAPNVTEGDQRVFIYDNTYSQNILDTGIRSRRVTISGRTFVRFHLVTGSSFNPRFLDVSSNAIVSDVILDLAQDTWLAPATVDKQNLPTFIASGDTTRFRTVNNDNGYLLQHSTSLIDSSTIEIVPVPSGNIAAKNFWSYTHECYGEADTDGVRSVLNVVPQAVTSGRPLEFTTNQDVQIANQTRLLVGSSLSDATTAATTGIDNIDRLFPLFKAINVNSRNITSRIRVEGTTFINAGDISFNSTTDSNIATNGTLNVNLTTTNSIEGGNIINTVQGVNISGAQSTTAVNLSLIGTSGINLENITIGNDVSLNGNITNFPITASSGLTIADSSTLNYNLDADTTITFDEAYPEVTVGTSITVNNAGTGMVTIIRQAGTLQGLTAGTNVTIQDAAYEVTLNVTGLSSTTGRIIVYNSVSEFGTSNFLNGSTGTQSNTVTLTGNTLPGSTILVVAGDTEGVVPFYSKVTLPTATEQTVPVSPSRFETDQINGAIALGVRTSDQIVNSFSVADAASVNGVTVNIGSQTQENPTLDFSGFEYTDFGTGNQFIQVVNSQRNTANYLVRLRSFLGDLTSAEDSSVIDRVSFLTSETGLFDRRLVLSNVQTDEGVQVVPGFDRAATPDDDTTNLLPRFIPATSNSDRKIIKTYITTATDDAQVITTPDQNIADVTVDGGFRDSDRQNTNLIPGIPGL